MVDRIMLENYLSLKVERKELTERIAKLKRQVDNMMNEGTVKDAVKGGEGGIQTYHIEGVPAGEITRKKSMLYSRVLQLEALVEQIDQDTAEIETFMSTIKDSKIRRIIGYKYLDGLTWNEIADKMDSTEDAVRKRYERYMENMQSC